jgi:hypothetical protein
MGSEPRLPGAPLTITVSTYFYNLQFIINGKVEETLKRFFGLATSYP